MKKITLLAFAFMAGVAFTAQAQEAEIVLTQNTDDVFIDGGVSCPGGDNFWMRSYVLEDEGITSDVMVTGMEIALSRIDFPDELEFYAWEHPGFPAGFSLLDLPAPIASAYVDLGPSDVGVVTRINFDQPVAVSSGATIVIAAVQPAANDNTIFLLTTAAETKGSFLGSEQCGLEDPTFPGDVDPDFVTAKHLINLVLDDELAVNDVLAGQVSIYPNPSTSVFNVQLPANVEVLSSSLVDVLGKTTNVTYNNGVVDASSLSKGVYFLTLNTDQGSYTQKVVKQ